MKKAGAAVLGALLTFFVCGGLHLVAAAVDATGLHHFHGFWGSCALQLGDKCVEAGDATTVVAGLAPASVVFISLWLIASYVRGSGWTALIIALSLLVVAGTLGLMIGAAIGLFFSTQCYTGAKCEYWRLVFPAYMGFGLGCMTATLFVRSRFARARDEADGAFDKAYEPG